VKGTPSAIESRVTRSEKRLSNRVVVSTILSAAIGGVLTASIAVIAIDRLVADHADQRLLSATDALAGEMDEKESESEQEPLAEILLDENAEIVRSGIRLAVFRGSSRVAGDARVTLAAPGQCENQGALGQRMRACAREHREWLLVAAQRSDDAALRWLYFGAGLGALLLSGLMGAAASVRLTRWALRPLTDLTEAVRALPPRGAEPEQLGEASDCQEVQEIRAALADLISRHNALLTQAHRFASDAAHELRTPLTMIAGELELLAEEESTDTNRSTLRALRERTARLAALVERLLVLAVPLSEQHHAFDTLAMADLLMEIVQELPAAQRERVELELEGEGLVRGEPSLLRSLFSNAIDNALKFSGDSPVHVRLSEPFSGSEPQPAGAAFVHVDVRDRGPGVPVRERHSVFRPLYRAQPFTAPGHGLGLALIGHIVRAHGGSVEFVDAERGACLSVQLPAWMPEATPG
jgi:signal transduction histidine kinase